MGHKIVGNLIVGSSGLVAAGSNTALNREPLRQDVFLFIFVFQRLTELG